MDVVYLRKNNPQAINMDRVIENKIMMVERLRFIATKTTSSVREDAGRGKRPQGPEETIAKIVAMEREINADIDRLVELKREIMGVLAQVEDSWCRIVLEKKYLGKLKTWEIAAELNYSIPWIDLQIRKGLEMVEKILYRRMNSENIIEN